MEQLSKEKVLEAQFGLDLKCLYRPNQNKLIWIMLAPQGQRKRVPGLGSDFMT